MGATNFSQLAFGKDARDAYDKAVKEALFENGHDTYNGTISTTGGFRLVTIDGPITQKKIDRKIDEAYEKTEKWGPCWAIEITGKMLKQLKERNGLKGTRQRAFIFAGWVAM